MSEARNHRTCWCISPALHWKSLRTLKKHMKSLISRDQWLYAGSNTYLRLPDGEQIWSFPTHPILKLTLYWEMSLVTRENELTPRTAISLNEPADMHQESSALDANAHNFLLFANSSFPSLCRFAFNGTITFSLLWSTSMAWLFGVLAPRKMLLSDSYIPLTERSTTNVLTRNANVKTFCHERTERHSLKIRH